MMRTGSMIPSINSKLTGNALFRSVGNKTISSAHITIILDIVIMQLEIKRCSYKPSKIRSGRVRLALQPSKSSQQPT